MSFPDNASVTAGREGREYVRQRNARGYQQQFPDHASYLRYLSGISYVQARRRAMPIPFTEPTNVTVTSEVGSARIAFSAPVSTGGAPIVSYTVIAMPGNITVTGTESPIVVSGLQQGQTYTFTVTASNGNRISTPSAATPPVTISTAPVTAPSILVVRGDSKLIVTVTPPTDNGGSPITGYKYSVDGGSFQATPTLTNNQFEITGLTNGTAYSVRILAVNAIGDGAISTAVSGTPATVPGAPTNVRGTPGNQKANIAFDAPVNTGGSAITGYTVIAYEDSTFVKSVPGGSVSPVVVTGLTNGTAYTFKVSATNDIGDSDPSIASAQVTPDASIPDEPTLQLALPDDESVYIYFKPASTGGTPTNYKYSLNGGSFTELATSKITSPIKISGLINGNSYSIKLRATNDAGDSFDSNELVSVVSVNSSVAAAARIIIDPSDPSCYAGSGDTVNNIGSFGPLVGTKTAAVTFISNVKGGVFDFSGSSTNILFPAYNFGSTITVTAWIYPRFKVNINGLIANVGANIAPAGFKFQWNWWVSVSSGPGSEPGRNLQMQAGNGTSGGDALSVQDLITYDTWQHVGYVFDKMKQKAIFFLNGLPVNVATIETVANIKTSDNAFSIGSYLGGSYAMNARLGYIKVFNTLLDATQMYADYNNSKSRFFS
jgi:hypothetical protein